MKVGEGIALRAMTQALRGVFQKHPRITVHHVLGALEELRYSVTEEVIKRNYPWLRPMHPLDKRRAPNELRPQQKRPPT